MGVWDTTTPAGSDSARDGDDRIRELKSALDEALSHEDSTFPGATPGSTPIFIPGMKRDTTANRPTGDSLVSGRFYANTTLNIIERYNGSSWDSVATNIPSGTVMLFYQANAPTGWTAVALNDKFLRVVTAGGTGGTSGGSGLTPSSTITLAHTHTVDSHTHTIGSHTHTMAHTHSIPHSGWGEGVDSPTGGDLIVFQTGGASIDDSDLIEAGSDATSGAASTSTTSTPSADATGADSPGTDSQLSNTAFQYADIIIATKD